MVEPDRAVDLQRIAAEERRVAEVKAAQERAERERLQAQGRLEKPR